MRRARATAALTAAILVLGGSTGAAAASADDGPRPARLCIPILFPCGEPAPSSTSTPTPTPTPGLTVPGLPELPGAGTSTPATPSTPDDSPTPAPSAPSAASTTPPAQAAVADERAPVFTQPSAQLGAQSLSFRGIPLISVVTVPLADGTRITALKMTADEITIEGFALTVRRETGPALVTTADRMTLSGHVSVYLNSLSATTADGKTLTLGADTPPPADGIAPGLARLTLGLVGTTADSIVYTNTDQKITEPG
ncbi:hypothetical protein QE418_003228 [Microbacterium testaceum]|uniref:hypothetical protein n=1 Tax=Microbacterium TaxID=33882 RepID=UPI0027897388|nr:MULTISPECIES: hypothetical protein [Microbacterium]MDQ1113780.1 hypothetical protein [Microbacterium testaceum]MDR6099115.1 hypothetical protein [Microbacterium sp. SORGH_AS_0454]